MPLCKNCGCLISQDTFVGGCCDNPVPVEKDKIVKSIALSYIQFAVDEGRESSIKSLEELRDSLEEIIEIGSEAEVAAATFLLDNVHQGLKDVLEGTLVRVARF